ncbi:MAG: PEGA domain-containing protein, partial [Acidobacteriota bacterium]|nr:PEGA domain-containing protein [Acidobacteriota bacterium]
RGQFAEAIGQWDILRSIHPQYPALSFEIEQLKRRREQQNQEEEKSRLVEQIDRALEVGDHDRARTLAQSGLTEYPEDAELAGLQRVATQASERDQQAQQLLEKGRQLCDSGKFEEGIETLRLASEVDPHGTAVRSALATALTDRARSVLKDDWRASEALIQQALEVDANYESAKSLRSSVQDHRRKETVGAFLAQARELQGKGEIAAAIAAVEQCLRTYPNEARLMQLRMNLQHAGEAEIRKGAGAHASPTRTIFQDPGVTQAPISPAQDSAADPIAETVAFAATLEPRRPVEPETVVPAPPAPPTSAKAPVAPVVPPAPPTPPSTQPPPTRPTPPTPVIPPRQIVKRRWSPLQIGGLAAIPLLIIGGWAVTHFSSRPAAVAAIPADISRPTYPVDIQATPRGALIKVDGSPMIGIPANLTEGPHTIEASLPGYAILSQKIIAGPNSQPIQFPLKPELQRVRLTTSFPSGKVLLDGKDAGELQGGMFSKDDVGIGEHTLQVLEGRRELLAVRFKSAIAAAAEILPPLKTQDLLVVSSFGDRAKIYSGPTAFRFALKDQSPQAVPAEGLNLVTSRSANELVASDGKTQHAMPIDSGNAPTIGIYVNDAADTRPILLVASNVEGAQLFLNGKAQNWSLYKGRFAGRVEPGSYTVKVSKPGYADIAEQTVKVEKGDTKTLQFALTAVPTKSALVIEGGTPGAEVWIDQTSKGHLDGSGHFSIDVSTGPHDIRLSKELHEPSDLGKRTATAGQELKIAGAEAKLKPFGTLNFQIATPGAEITYKREDEGQSHTAKGDEGVPVKEGRYQISISAAKFEPREDHVTVTAGKPTPVTGPLVSKGEQKADASSHREQTLFLTPAAWEQDESGYWVTRAGYGWIAGASGTFHVDLLRKSRKLFAGGTNEWVIGYRNKGKDKVIYKLSSDGALTRAVTVEGKTSEVKLAQRVTAGDAFRLQILIEPTRIVIQDVDKGKVDEYTNPDADFTAGNFGFNKGVHLKIKR